MTLAEDRKDHAILRTQIMLATGDFNSGFVFYGPFESDKQALDWAQAYLKPGTGHTCHPLMEPHDAHGLHP